MCSPSLPLGKGGKSALGQSVAELLGDNSKNGFWDRVKEFVDLVKPMFAFLTLTEADFPVIGRIYHNAFKVSIHPNYIQSI